MKRIAISIIVVFLYSGSAAPQKVVTGLQGLYGLTLDGFGAALDQNGYGPGLSFRMSVPETPLWFGLDFAQQSLKKESRFVSSKNGAFAGEPLKGEIMANIAVRIQLEREGLLPYVEGLIGLRHFYSQSQNDKDPVYYEQDGASGFSTSEAARVLGAGIGAGVLFHIYQYGEESESAFSDIYLEARAAYMSGGELRIGTPGDQGELAKVKAVRPEIIMFQIGVLFSF